MEVFIHRTLYFVIDGKAVNMKCGINHPGFSSPASEGGFWGYLQPIKCDHQLDRMQ